MGTKTNMKLFLIAAVLIASVFAEPESEAKADAWYGAYGYGGYPYAGAYGGYAGYPYAATYGASCPSCHLRSCCLCCPSRHLRRSSPHRQETADSDAEAKPWLAYSNYGYAGYPYASTYGAYAAPVATYAHAAYTTPYATYGGAHLIGKRSADSEPESWYGAYGYASPYTTYGGYSAYRPYTYGRYAYGRYGYGW